VARYVFPGKSTCQLCHHYSGGVGQAEPDRIVPVDVPEVWYEHSRFSHGAHRTVDCRGCHGGKNGGKSVDDSEVETDVLLPPRENCLKCHSTARTVGGDKEGGVRHECVTCHGYHHADNPLAGRGSSGRGIEKRVSVEDLLNARFPK